MTEPRCYVLAELLARLKMSSRTFFRLHARGEMPFLEELRPRLGNTPRYRADLVDSYLRGEWQRQRFGSLRRVR